MSTLQPIEIQCGFDVGFSMHITHLGLALDDVSGLVMEMRRDVNPNAQLLARFDQTGTGNGSIQANPRPGYWDFIMTAAQSSRVPPGRGFWDLAGTIDGKLVKLSSGAVLFKPTALVAQEVFLP